MGRQRNTVQRILSGGRQSEAFRIPAHERSPQHLPSGREINTKMPLDGMHQGTQIREYRAAHSYRTLTHHDQVQGMWNILCSPGFTAEAYEKLVRGPQCRAVILLASLIQHQNIALFLAGRTISYFSPTLMKDVHIYDTCDPL